MSRRYVHVVVTRFNVAVVFAPRDRRLDLEWLERRLRPFERFCYPSMLAQTAPYRWLMLLDADTPPEFRRRLAAFDAVTPVWMEEPHSVAAVGAAVRDNVELEGLTHLITTRLDSDDALAGNHLGEVQRRARLTEQDEFVNFPLGCQWVERRIYLCFDVSSPFLSYVEPLGRGTTPSTVYRMAHVWAERIAPLRQLWAPPMWMQVLHDANDVSVSGGVRHPGRRVPSAFRGQDAFASIDETHRLEEFVRGAPGYMLARRGMARAAMPRRRSPGRP